MERKNIPCKLSDQTVKKANIKDKSYKLSDGAGLYLLVHKNGGKYWRLNYRYNKKQKTLALGIYPYISLKQAREETYTARKQFAVGDDPADPADGADGSALLRLLALVGGLGLNTSGVVRAGTDVPLP